MGKKRRRFSAELKAKIALEAMREQYTMSEMARKYEVHPAQVTLWKKQLVEGLPVIFNNEKVVDESARDEKEALLYQQIGQLQFELDWLKKKSGLP